MNIKAKIVNEEYVKENKKIIENISYLLNDIKKEKNVNSSDLNSCELSSAKIKKKYKKTINEAFTKIIENFDELFDVAYIIIEDFNITPENFIMCLDNDNRQKLRNYAENNFNIRYWKEKERERNEKKNKKKYSEYSDSENLLSLFKR